MTSSIVYKGELRTEAAHLQSGVKIITDAPTDNRGKGAYFSPTDLGATSLACCMVTIMGIKAADKGIDIDGTTLEVQKVMASNPRRISEIIVNINMPERKYSEKEKKILSKAALTCPMAHSLHPDIKQVVTIKYND